MNIIRKILRFIVISVCCIIGLMILLTFIHEISMIDKSFVHQELERMGLYEDLPDFPDFKIRGFRHRWKKSRYDYALRLSHPISPECITKIDSLSHVKNVSIAGWHFEDEKGQYIMFFWDVAGECNDFLMITPGEITVKFVFEAPSRSPERSDDLFYGPA